MKRLTSIVAMNHEGAIGVRNGLPWRLKTDLRFFKETTFGHVVIMGRLTFASLGSKPLPGRCNIVLSHSYNLFPSSKECMSALGINEGLFRAAKAAGRSKECYVIGGASMYEQFSPYVDRYIVTLVDKRVDDADTFVDPALFGCPDGWKIERLRRVEADSENEASFSILELTAADPGAFSARREAAIAEHESRLARKPAAVTKRYSDLEQPRAVGML
jgi:dihydrofolate reductase